MSVRLLFDVIVLCDFYIRWMVVLGSDVSMLCGLVRLSCWMFGKMRRLICRVM